jgi:hypothetical protein
MNSHKLAEWLSTLSVSERIRALALIYSNLTVAARELFLPERGEGRQTDVLEQLRWLNEFAPQDRWPTHGSRNRHREDLSHGSFQCHLVRASQTSTVSA